MPENVTLDTRNRRAALAERHRPYWVTVERGVAIGYRKTEAGGVWYVRRFNGQGYHTRALGQTDDDHEADGQTRLSWRDALAAALATPKAEAEVRTRYSVADAFEDYWRSRAAAGRSSESLAFDKGKAAGFVEEFGSARVADLTTGALKRWRDALATVAPAKGQSEAELRERRRRAQATANRTWSVIRAGLNSAFQSGRVESDTAWRRVRPFAAVDKPRTRFLSVAEARALLAHASADFEPLAHAALLSGARFGELSRLVVGDFDGERLNLAEGKSRRPRTVPLTSDGVKAFKRWTAKRDRSAVIFTDGEGRPWTRPKASRRMAEASAAAKLDPPATFHDLRRSYGSLLANAQTSDTVIAAALGHADTRMTRRHYAHIIDRTIAAEIEAKLPKFGGTRKRRK